MNKETAVSIGYYNISESSDLISEIKYGVEESGGFYALYSMDDALDIRFNESEAAITVNEHECALYARGPACCEAIAKEHLLTEGAGEMLRIMGKNAIRYIKNQPLHSSAGLAKKG